jgi:hypothetical protein
MATINLGAIKFNWQGAYAGGTAYAVDDVVSYNGSSYVCILASTGNLPTNATYFEQMSSAGTNGTNGTDLTTTLTTQGDIFIVMVQVFKDLLKEQQVKFLKLILVQLLPSGEQMLVEKFCKLFQHLKLMFGLQLQVEQQQM